MLSRLTRDLTADARAGRLEPVRCRAEEIARVVDILLRQGKNNPALVGAAGVGKTAIVEGLAQRIARGEVPLSLRGVRILAVDHVSLLAGTTYRGQYEERIRAIVAESTSQPDVVLFIDELHNLIGQGTAMGAPMDAGNMLKPALVRGDFRVIGATTDDEYEKWVCGDPALERRFQKVAVRELSDEETLEILRARKSRLERHHNVVISDDALAASIELTDAWVLDRMRPDRAIDALDEACAHTHAVAAYDDDTERLIVERRELARRDLARRDAEAAASRRADAERAGRRDSGPRQRVADDEARHAAGDDRFDDADDDGLERLARGGFAALERFGAEIEAMLGVAPPPPPAEAPRAASAPPPPPPSPSAPRANGVGTSRSLAELDALLERRLTERGIVVRGHDVARVVGLSVGRPVQWPA
ncbi:MAG TPA: AAA family ATPase [Gemmatimonadaceae bacterium]|nr:AAA family ATPase [Gemmatimonadaceae bacterium]